jgi:acyl dehydratase
MPESKKSPDEIYEEAKKMIGRETPPMIYPYPIEYEPIRRYCLMLDDDNPLYLDPEYARKTSYGGVPYPPLALFGIMGRGSPAMMAGLTDGSAEEPLMPPTPGKFLINMAQEWEWFAPVLVGDRLTMTSRIGDVYIKPIRIDPKAFWIVLEFHFSNQRGEKVGVVKNIVLCHRSPEEVAAQL